MTINEKIKKFGRVKVLEDLGHYGLSKKLAAALQLKKKAKGHFKNMDKVLNECGELEIKAFEVLYRYK